MSSLFLLILAFRFLHERVGFMQLCGIVLVLIGAYALEVSHHNTSFVEPFKKLLTSKYQLLTILALLIFSITSVFDKFIISNGIRPFVYLCYLWIFNGFNFIVIDFAKFRLRDVENDLRKKVLPIVLIAFLNLLASVFYILAISVQMVSLVVPVKRLSTLFDTVIGGRLFHEKGIKFKIMACIAMILGTYFMTIKP